MATTKLDPYTTLGIPHRATRAEAARAHRRLAKRFHPDVNPSREAANRMRLINEAWQILSDPARRASYDLEHGGGHWPRHGYRAAGRSGDAPRPATAAWTTWPEDRRTSAARARRAARPQPVEPSFGDHPAAVVVVWVVLGLIYFVGSWLGSMTP